MMKGSSSLQVPNGGILPPPIRSNKPGTWAFDTMSRRIVENILPRILEDNADELTQPSIAARSETFLQLNDLKSSLAVKEQGYLRPLVEDGGEDIALWNSMLGQLPDSERNWLDAPWVLTEFYFYRRIIECFKFFQDGYDPFHPQKFAGLVDALAPIESIAEKIPEILCENIDTALTLAVQTSLWGNKMGKNRYQ